MVVALALAGLFVGLGFWQLDRLDQRRVRNATITERMNAEPEQFQTLIANAPGVDTLTHRHVTVQGVYRPDLEFFSIGRTYGDLTGTLVLTPLEIEGGDLIVVERGLIPSDTPGPPAEGYEAPAGTVILTGRLDGGEAPLRMGEPEPEGGVLRSLSRIDLDYIDRWIDGPVMPLILKLDASDPAGNDPQPVRVPDEELTEGQHLGYAIQWFAFAVIAIVGAGYLVYRAGTRDGTSLSESDRETAPIP